MTEYGKKMKDQRPRIRKVKKEPTRERKPRNPPQITGFWGRGASLYRPGLFTKKYFEKHGEACAADVYYALSQEIERLNKERIEIGEKPFQRPNYSSFSRYFHWFLILGLTERTDRREPAIYDFLEKRVFYRLTDKGKAEVSAWEDPVRAAHPEFG
ncbi:MAG: hypothetical protein E3J60_04225 [Dehalococcoidia bacterium]|nr:MAG: hypothetical protein E3J60_04225 [Dehalococcoidia bacterium]